MHDKNCKCKYCMEDASGKDMEREMKQKRLRDGGGGKMKGKDMGKKK